MLMFVLAISSPDRICNLPFADGKTEAQSSDYCVCLWPQFLFWSLDIHPCDRPVDATACLTMVPQTPALPPREISGDGKNLAV